MDEIVQAIWKLRPGAEFSLINNDYATIKWDVLIGEAPTQAEIDAAIEQIKADEIADAAQSAAAKASATAKLEALGLTTDDLKALGLGSN